jgi:hypothetical protein
MILTFDVDGVFACLMGLSLVVVALIQLKTILELCEAVKSFNKVFAGTGEHNMADVRQERHGRDVGEDREIYRFSSCI